MELVKNVEITESNTLFHEKNVTDYLIKDQSKIKTKRKRQFCQSPLREGSCLGKNSNLLYSTVASTPKLSNNETNCAEKSHNKLLNQQEVFFEWQDEKNCLYETNDSKKSSDSYFEVTENINTKTPSPLLDDESVVNNEVANLLQKINSAALSKTASSKFSKHSRFSPKCCRCTFDKTCFQNSDNAPTSTTVELDNKILHSKITELKVQDLKTECKKRQLAVSGSKIQILERLKPYEDEIILEYESRNMSTNCGKNVNLQLEKNKNTPTTNALTSSTSTIDLSVIDAVASNTLSITMSQNLNSCQDSLNNIKNNKETVRDVINNFLQQKQNPQLPALKSTQNFCNKKEQKAQNKNQNSYQNSTHQTFLQETKLQNKLNTNNFDSELGNNMQSCSNNKNSLKVCLCHHLPQCDTILNNYNDKTICYSNNSEIAYVNEFNPSQVSEIKKLVEQQKVNESNFGFAQINSNEQFTLIENNKESNQQQQNLHNNQFTETFNSSDLHINLTKIPVSSTPKSIKNNSFDNVYTSSNNLKQDNSSKFFTNCNCCHKESSQSWNNEQQNFVNYQESNNQFLESQNQQFVSQDNKVISVSNNPQLRQNEPFEEFLLHSDNTSETKNTGNLSDLGIKRRHSFASCHSNFQTQQSISDQYFTSYSNNENLLHQGNEFINSNSENNIFACSFQFDPFDPNSVATTLSQHEEVLRNQQKKIHELQQELAYSQQNLRYQQQMIWIAKKSQIHRDANGNRQTQAEFWLTQLDTNNLISNILQHKSQQQQLQMQIAEHGHLVTIEQKLQEQLHVDQAIEDIVRIIKQDAKTALLIVQLLRKYQLERANTIFFSNENKVQTLNEQKANNVLKVHNNLNSLLINSSPSSSQSCTAINQQLQINMPIQNNNNNRFNQQIFNQKLDFATNKNMSSYSNTNNNKYPLTNSNQLETGKNALIVTLDDSPDSSFDIANISNNFSSSINELKNNTVVLNQQVVKNKNNTSPVKAILTAAVTAEKTVPILKNNVLKNKKKSNFSDLKNTTKSSIFTQKLATENINLNKKNNYLTTDNLPKFFTKNTNKNNNCSNINSIDMEEIFQTVLKDSKQSESSSLTTANNSKNTSSTEEKKNKHEFLTTVAEKESIKLTSLPNKNSCLKKKTSTSKTTCNNFSNDKIEENQNKKQITYIETTNSTKNTTGKKNYVQSKQQIFDIKENCVTESNIQQQELCQQQNSIPDSSVNNCTLLNINCFNKSHTNENAVSSFSSEKFLKNSASFDFSKNEFDDLMDVLRNDQEKSFLGINDCSSSSNNNDIGYTDELLNFLADDSCDSHNFQQMFHNNNNSNINSLNLNSVDTTQNNLQTFSPSKNSQISFEQNVFLNQNQQFNKSTTNYLINNNDNNCISHSNFILPDHQNDTMDIIPPLSIDENTQSSRDTFSTLSCNANKSTTNEVDNNIRQTTSNSDLNNFCFNYFDKPTFENLFLENNTDDQEIEWLQNTDSNFIYSNSFDSSFNQTNDFFTQSTLLRQQMNAFV